MKCVSCGDETGERHDLTSSDSRYFESFSGNFGDIFFLLRHLNLLNQPPFCNHVSTLIDGASAFFVKKVMILRIWGLDQVRPNGSKLHQQIVLYCGIHVHGF